MVFTVVSAHKDAEGMALRFGGACMISSEPAALTRIAPGESVDLGTVRYQSLKGGYPEAMYAFRALLDEKGPRAPGESARAGQAEANMPDLDRMPPEPPTDASPECKTYDGRQECQCRVRPSCLS